MRKPILAALGAAALACAAAGALAQGYPKGAITLVIPVAPGDAADTAGRMMAEELSRLLNVPVVAVNRPGAGGSLAADSVAKAGKDGHTILFSVNSALTFRRVLEPQGVNYDPATDLAALGLATRTPSVLAVRSEGGFRDLAEMVERSKANPGAVRVGTAGPGSAGDFCVQILNSVTGAQITMVPFKGAAPAMTALRGGHIEGVVLALGALSGQFRSGALRGLAISSPFPEFPQIPTLTQLGYRQNLLGVWLAFFSPGGVSAEVTGALVPAIEKSVRNPAIAEKLAPLGIVQDYAPPDALLAEMRAEYRMVDELARKAGLVK